MNDYKELIEDLRLGLTCGPYRAVTVLKSMLSEAADAIEQLVKERDAAVADLEFGRCCTTCLNYKNKNCPPNKCLTTDNDNWEWRGVQEVEHETD